MNAVNWIAFTALPWLLAVLILFSPTWLFWLAWWRRRRKRALADAAASSSMAGRVMEYGGPRL